jgi:hypothetical protein
MDGREELRRSYLPESVRLLFVGESPPASGRFFYQKDSGLYRAFRDAFRAVDPEINDENFLARFREAGCYLIDLCPDPVDHMKPRERREACRVAEPALAEAIRVHNPPAMAIFLKSIEPYVGRAIARAEWSGKLICTPYPGRFRKNRELFFEIVTPALRGLL